MKEVLIGTPNPSKVKRFESFLTGYDIKGQRYVLILEDEENA